MNKKLIFATALVFALFSGFYLIERGSPDHGIDEASVVFKATEATGAESVAVSVKTSQSSILNNSACELFLASLVTNSFSWWLGVKPLPVDDLAMQEIEAYRARNLDNAEAIIKKDLVSGINQQVRNKEAKLQAAVSNLRLGEKLEDSKRILGVPDIVFEIAMECEIIDGRFAGLKRFDTKVAASFGKDFSTETTFLVSSYWPRVGVPFDGRNGQGYRVLYLVADRSRTLRCWFWEQPTPSYKGLITANISERQYWEGATTNSPAPLGMSWY
jgi:hypothetical protein